MRLLQARNPVVAKDKINLLLVDDEEALLDSIQRRLQVRHFNVIAVNRGDKALEAARKHPIDIALLDLKMPGMSGKDVLLSLKREFPWLEIVILTGHGAFDPDECAYEKACSFLMKPCELETLLDVLVEAYKKTVMNRHHIGRKQIDDALEAARSESARDILKTLMGLDAHFGGARGVI